MKKRTLLSRIPEPVRILVPTVILLLLFSLALDRAEGSQREKTRLRLEENLRLAAVACYAAEGVYPPDVDYLAEHYGVTVDGDRYTVFYEIFAENIMPQITVVEKKS